MGPLLQNGRTVAIEPSEFKPVDEYVPVPGSSRAPRPAGALRRLRVNLASTNYVLRAWAGRFELKFWEPDDKERTFIDQNGQEAVYEDEGPGSANLVLTFYRIQNTTTTSPLSINLTAMTADELRCLRDTMVAGINLAIPEAERRDNIAKEAATNGDFSNTRISRQVPQVRWGAGKGRFYNEGLQLGSEGFPGLVWPFPDSQRGDVDAGNEVAADGDEEQGHERPTPVVDESVLPVG